MNYWLGGLIVLVGAPLMGGLIEVGAVRPFEKAPRLLLTMATIGIAQLFIFFELLIPLLLGKPTHGASSTPIGLSGQIRSPLSHATLRIGGVYFSGDHLAAIIVVALVGLGLAAFFRFTDIGIAVRASAESGDRAQLLGIPVRRVSTIVWMIAGLLSGVGIFLRAPIVGMATGGVLLGAGVLLYALAAAVIARMESLSMALAAGLAIGVIDQTVFYATRNPNISQAIMLPIILVALLLQRGSIARAHDTGVATWQLVKEFRPIPAQLQRLREVVIARKAVLAAAAVVMLTLPFIFGGLRYNTATLVLIYSLVGVSLVMLTGWAGQISLGQWAISGMGAAVAGGLAANHGADFFVTLFVAGLAGAALSVAIGLPALRMPGLFLAVTTLAFAANMQYFFLNGDYFGWLIPKSTARVYRPMLYGRIDTGNDLTFYYVCLVVVALAVLSARALRHSRSGRILIASRDNPRTTQAYGIDLVHARLIAFGVSGFFAAVAGALFAYLYGAVDAPAFTGTASAALFTMAAIGGLTSLSGAFLGALYFVIFGAVVRLPYDLQYILQGGGALMVLRFAPGGLAELGYRIRDTFLARVSKKYNLDAIEMFEMPVQDSQHLVPVLPVSFGSWGAEKKAAAPIAVSLESQPVGDAG
jgi:branched-chain amino acid transport system permease protein